jgi:hypothetical protein
MYRPTRTWASGNQKRGPHRIRCKFQKKANGMQGATVRQSHAGGSNNAQEYPGKTMAKPCKKPPKAAPDAHGHAHAGGRLTGRQTDSPADMPPNTPKKKQPKPSPAGAESLCVSVVLPITWQRTRDCRACARDPEDNCSETPKKKKVKVRDEPPARAKPENPKSHRVAVAGQREREAVAHAPRHWNEDPIHGPQIGTKRPISMPNRTGCTLSVSLTKDAPRGRGWPAGT